MTAGQQFSVLHKRKPVRILLKILGTSDVHTHYRIKPLTKWAKKSKSNISKKSIVEIGCGMGTNIFELASQLDSTNKFYGYDLNAKAIEDAKEITKRNKIPNAYFENRDCTVHRLEQKANILLLMDFLEHIQNPEEFLNEITESLSHDATVLVSVPTPNFPNIFGWKFHNSIGHLRAGFTYTELEAMLASNGFVITEKKFNTGLIASAACRIYYKTFYDLTGYKKRILGYALSLLRNLDWINNEKMSASLFIVATRTAKGKN